MNKIKEITQKSLTTDSSLLEMCETHDMKIQNVKKMFCIH